MHYKNGREAKNGDKVIYIPTGEEDPFLGVLINAKAERGSDCNGYIIPFPVQGQHYADLKNCLHVDDIAAATIPDSQKTNI